ncbi:MAG: ACT domain-containing protein [Oscillospiraceae bacterium]|nr:ACT domain-containing protein [Clostridia bacterium]MBR3239399.1 ACT domain-containing protein [Oscillospiraceae bacterium]
MNDYLIVEKSALPDYFIKVVEARRLLQSGVYTQVIDAVHAAGISRSTYYKYKDKILETSQLTVGRKASLMLQLNHRAGMLSKVINTLSGCNANILTITQSLPIHGKASIMLSIDLSQLSRGIDEMVDALSGIDGVEQVRLLAVE